jgi:hypothetical protein
MAQTTFAEGKGIIHRGSGGIQKPGPPDVCLTKVGKPVVPLPYENVSRAEDIINGPATVLTDGEMPLVKDGQVKASTGDEPGDRKGVASGTITGPSDPVTYAFTVFFEGRNVCFVGSQFFHNTRNTMG